MAKSTLVDVYNIVLEALGQRPLSSGDVNLADKYASQITRFIDNAKREVLLSGYVFCREKILIVSDVSNGNKLNVNAYLKVWLEEPYVVRSVNGIKFIYDRENNVFPTTQMLVDVARDLDWTDMPEEAYQYIAHAAAVRALVSMKGAVAEANYYEGKKIEYLAALENLHHVNDAGIGTGSNAIINSYNI